MAPERLDPDVRGRLTLVVDFYKIPDVNEIEEFVGNVRDFEGNPETITAKLSIPEFERDFTNE